MKIKEVAHTPQGTALILEGGKTLPWEDIATANSVFAGDYIIASEEGATVPYYHCPKATFVERYELAKEPEKKDEPEKKAK